MTTNGWTVLPSLINVNGILRDYEKSTDAAELSKSVLCQVAKKIAYITTINVRKTKLKYRNIIIGGIKIQ